MAAVQAAGPIAMAASQHIAVAGGNDKSRDESKDDDDETAVKCDQLVHHPPGVEEIRRTANLGIESREIRLERAGESYRWVVYRSSGASPEGWRTQNRLDRLRFNPPLQYLLSDKEPRYLAYAVSIPETAEDSEQMMTIADDFGSKVGTFDWHNTQHTYTVSKHLPCFPEPEQK